MKKLPPKILVNFCVSLLGLYLVFLLGVERRSDSNHHRITCQIVAAVLHYLTLTTFAWTLVQAYNLYQSLVRIFNTGSSNRSFITVASIFSWGRRTFRFLDLLCCPYLKLVIFSITIFPINTPC